MHMKDYPFDSILINNRPVSIDAIVNGKASYFTDFERETLSFIEQWLNNNTTFTFQTSGSTGNPTVVTFSKQQLEISAAGTIKALALHAGDIALVCLPTKYTAGKMMLARALLNKMKIVAVEPGSDPLNNITSSIDLAAFVPMQMQVMLDKGRASMINNIKAILIGGSPVDHILKNEIRSNLTTSVYATYGMTETLSHIALQNLTASDDYYTTMPGVGIRLDDRGCLAIRTPYLENEVITNDLVELLSDSTFKWLGRLDNIINSGGIKIQAEELEKQIDMLLKELGIKNRFFIAGRPDRLLGEAVELFIEGTLPIISKERLYQALTQTLTPYHAPRRIHEIKRFKETETGKIDRRNSLKNIGNPS